MPIGQKAYTAFEAQLRTLCLNEFPCGIGPWRKDQGSVPDTHFSVTLKDYGVQKEQGEVLEELITSPFSPYSVDYSWSNEAQRLRETAVETPWVVNQTFIKNHFQTLRIVDKKVNEADGRLLEFPQLKELTLSGNYIETINSKNLPRCLEVLELVANSISDLQPLCEDPPPNLQHLGLGHNKIAFISHYLTEQYWPNLLSLDLSHNDLCGLPDVIHQLSSLTKLRNLSLIANPLALIPGYRGFVVDSLRYLSILDDLMISADEKHHFKGLARRKDLIIDESTLVVQISHLSGVPMPDELKVTEEEQPEFPIIERRYYIELTFLEDKLTRETRMLRSEVKLKEETMETTEETAQLSQEVAAEGIAEEGVASVDVKAVPMNTESDDRSGKVFSVTEEVLSHDAASSPMGVVYCTDKLPWNEQGLDFNYIAELVFDDLPALKESLKRELFIAVKEDKVICTPVEEADGRASVGSKKGLKDAKNTKDKAGKKKKKEVEIELNRSEPEVQVLAKYNLSLVEFVEGEHHYSNKCIFEAVESQKEEEACTMEKKKRKDSGKGKKKKVPTATLR